MFKDKIIVVTGGSRGIGKAIVESFVNVSPKHIIVTSRSKEACDACCNEFNERHPGLCISIPWDLGKVASLNEYVDVIKSKGIDRVHVLCNNAGASWGSPIEQYPEEAWDKLLSLNVKSPFFLVQKLLPLLKEAAKSGTPANIVNIGSINGLQPPIMETYAYSASKAALHHLSRHLARRLAQYNICVNTIACGLFDTKMTKGTIKKVGKDNMVQDIPLQRFGNNEDIGSLVLFLSNSKWVTGSLVVLDGGMSLLSRF